MSSRAHRVSAPGKLMLAGEYAVLWGHPCLVAAVSRRAVVRLGPPGDGSPRPAAHSAEWGPTPAEALLARKMAEKACGAIEASLQVNVTALRQSDQKLGLGSSAAAAAAAAGAVFAWHGQDLGDDSVRQEVLAAAMAGHRAVAPEGSGADVAASVLGGYQRFLADPLETRPLAWPAEVRARVVWTGTEARTSTFLDRVRALESRDQPACHAAMDRIGQEAERLMDAADQADGPGVVAAADAHGDAMAALGDLAGVPIVSAELGKIRDLARAAGGAAKPSGAGGGDVAVAFFTEAEAEMRFEEACTESGFALLSVALGEEGIRAEEESS